MQSQSLINKAVITVTIQVILCLVKSFYFFVNLLTIKHKQLNIRKVKSIDIQELEHKFTITYNFGKLILQISQILGPFALSSSLTWA